MLVCTDPGLYTSRMTISFPKMTLMCIFIAWIRSKLRCLIVLPQQTTRGAFWSSSKSMTLIFSKTLTQIILFAPVPCATQVTALHEAYQSRGLCVFLLRVTALSTQFFRLGFTKNLNWLINIDGYVCWLSTVFINFVSNTGFGRIR